MVSIEVDIGVPCAGWDGPTAHALSHPVADVEGHLSLQYQSRDL